MWVLIIIATAGVHGVSVNTQEFASKESCVFAVQQVKNKIHPSYYHTIQCVPK